ncbi:hypothetical protein DXG01_013693, partial [Tephrocybe rancida]
MRLGDMAYKYNGVHCFGFIVNLQPDHTGRTGTAMWGATPAFEQMKIDEKDVISRQIANWEALIRRAEMKLNGDSNEEAEKDLWIVNIAPSKPERDHSRKVFVAWLKSRILYSRGEPLKKCLKMTMPWSHWPNFAFKHKLCLIEWPSTARPPDGKRYEYKDASNGLGQLQINASNRRRDEDYLDKYTIQIVSWDKEDIEREIDNDDLREVPLVTNSSGHCMISADDSEAYMDALAEFNGLTI